MKTKLGMLPFWEKYLYDIIGTFDKNTYSHTQMTRSQDLSTNAKNIKMNINI